MNNPNKSGKWKAWHKWVLAGTAGFFLIAIIAINSSEDKKPEPQKATAVSKNLSVRNIAIYSKGEGYDLGEPMELDSISRIAYMTPELIVMIFYKNDTISNFKIIQNIATDRNNVLDHFEGPGKVLKYIDEEKYNTAIEKIKQINSAKEFESEILNGTKQTNIYYTPSPDKDKLVYYTEF